ncbi:MAG: type I restriction enzyme HsdR N-terminal domain-containing protein [Magnetococcales bacterium]|nr:type I restriction enzyme HsdR N-terminal domain-containing protein [Magnetococcales bacterium]
MEFIIALQEIQKRIKQSKKLIKTEESAKHSFVIPFIKALGYDVYDPSEVVPEFTADTVGKKGEKVDYAIIKDGCAVMLLECKWCGVDLNIEHASQLYRYFSVLDTRIGILTNGITYQFFTDLEKSNQMDQRPFLEINLETANETQLNELRRFAKSKFDIKVLVSAAEELKYTKEIKQRLIAEFENPSEEFVRLFAGKVYIGRLTKEVMANFTELVKRACGQFVNDEINRRISSALVPEMPSESVQDHAEVKKKLLGQSEKQDTDEGIVTTEDEYNAFLIVRDISKQIVNPERVLFRDTLSYCAIILDDNRRKTICRCHFNITNKKKIELFDTDEPVKIEINDVSEIKYYSDRLISTIKKYLNDPQ